MSFGTHDNPTNAANTGDGIAKCEENNCNNCHSLTNDLTAKHHHKGIVVHFFSVLFLLCFLTCKLSATNYYVKANGGSGAGTSDASAWSFDYFLSKSQTLSPGDNVSFRSGDTYLVTNTVKLRTGVSYGAYGTGAKPVFSGFTTISSWTSSGNGVYYAPLTYDVDFLLFDGAQTGKGRYPKETYNFLTYEGGGKNDDGSGYIIDNDLSGSPSWAGAMAVIRCSGQQWQRKQIDNQTDGKLSFSKAEGLNFGNGYFLQNHPNILTPAFKPVVGDWYFDQTAGRIYMYFGNGTPQQHSVKVPLGVDIISSPSKTDLSVNGLCVEGSNEGGIVISNSSKNMTIDGNEVRYCGIGIGASGASSACTIQNNYVHDCVNKGIAGPITPTAYTIQGNRLIRIGMIVGAGESGSSSYSAIYFEGGNGFTVRRNYIDSVGFIGIRCFRGANVLVEENVIKNFGFFKDDNGAIYAWAAENDSSYARFTNRIVRRNIIVNGRPEGANGAPAGSKRENGIYLDSRSHHFIFDGNIVDNVYGFGSIILAGCQDITAVNNIFFRTARSGLIWATYNAKQPMRDMNVHNNIAYAVGGSPAIELRSPSNDYSQFGSFHDNYYLTDNSVAFRTTGSDGGGAKTLAQFQSTYNLEKNSTWQTGNDNDFSLLYNEHITDTTYNFPGKQFVNVKTGEAVSNSITLAPFTGVVLARKNRL